MASFFLSPLVCVFWLAVQRLGSRHVNKEWIGEQFVEKNKACLHSKVTFDVSVIHGTCTASNGAYYFCLTVYRHRRRGERERKKKEERKEVWIYTYRFKSPFVLRQLLLAEDAVFCQKVDSKSRQKKDKIAHKRTLFPTFPSAFL